MTKLNNNQINFALELYKLRNNKSFNLDMYQKFELIRLYKEAQVGGDITINDVTQDRLNTVRDIYIRIKS